MDFSLILNFLTNLYLVLKTIIGIVFKFIWQGHGAPVIFSFLPLILWRIFFVLLIFYTIYKVLSNIY